MADRIITMRESLYQGLVDRNTPGGWEHVKKQIGMFSFVAFSLPYSLSPSHLFQKANLDARRG